MIVLLQPNRLAKNWYCVQLEDSLSTVVQFCIDLHAQRQAAATGDNDDDNDGDYDDDYDVFPLRTLCQLYLDIGDGKNCIYTCRLVLTR